MKFGHLFEFLKIPDWYTEYLHYNELKDKISEFKSVCKNGEAKKLKGYYMINKHGQLYCIDFIKENNPNRFRKGSKQLPNLQAYFSLSELNSRHEDSELANSESSRAITQQPANDGGDLPNFPLTPPPEKAADKSANEI